MPPPASLAIHLDLVGGLAGDMFVAAVADAFPEIGAAVLAELKAVAPPGAGAPEFRETSTGGLRARHFGLPLPPAGAARAEAHAGHGIAHAATADGHGHSGTAYAVLRRRMEDAPLTAATRDHALALLALLAGAEARVHGIPVEDVHFHELADWDSLQDLVAAGCIAARLQGASWTASAPPLGSGTVVTAHGVLPVPAPATALLLTGYPWRDDGIPGERVTPTGAAILRHLVPPSACAAARDGGRLAAVGCGAGTRALPGIANIVRALVFARSASPAADPVVVIEFDVDDMTGEEIAMAADRLRAEAGVIDVSVGTRHGKKGRPVADFRLLARPAAADAILHASFAETSTLGLRVSEERRQVLRRRESATTIGGAEVRVKIALRPDFERTAKAAHDDVATAGGLAERRRIRALAEQHMLDAEGE